MIVAIDVSNSMTATDVAPTRFAAAQQAALAFVDAQPDTVDIGVVGFDQGALTTALPSADRAAAKAAVENLRTSGGTSLGVGHPRLAERDHRQDRDARPGRRSCRDLGYWGSATIVLFSDGEDSRRRGPVTQRARRRHSRAERRHPHRDRRRRHGRRHHRRGRRLSRSTPRWTPTR